LGLGVSLDDFGTGFSSITYLKKFPIDIIKINQVFMQDVLSNKENIEMAKAIISLANNLNLTLIAEVVENEAIVNFLKEQGCLICQGNYFAKPMLTKELLAWEKK